MNYKKLSKIADSTNNVTIRERMLENLKDRLDRGEIIEASGADRPGENVIYCTNKTFKEAASMFIEHFLDEDEWNVDRLVKESGINPEDHYIKINKDWNDTGEFYSKSSDSVEDLNPAIRSILKLNTKLVDKGIITEDQVEFEDDNNEFVENISYLDDIPEEIWNEVF